MEKNKQIRIQGYFTEYDIYNRAKLMFLDDYGDEAINKSILPRTSFTKSYLMNKLKTIEGNHPIVDDNRYFLVNCGKNALGYLPDTETNLSVIKMVPIQQLKQHTVECLVTLKKYNFKKGDKQIQGWNLVLSRMTMLEY